MHLLLMKEFLNLNLKELFKIGLLKIEKNKLFFLLSLLPGSNNSIMKLTMLVSNKSPIQKIIRKESEAIASFLHFLFKDKIKFEYN
jgi:hypothetical protein